MVKTKNGGEGRDLLYEVMVGERVGVGPLTVELFAWKCGNALLCGLVQLGAVLLPLLLAAAVAHSDGIL